MKSDDECDKDVMVKSSARNLAVDRGFGAVQIRSWFDLLRPQYTNTVVSVRSCALKSTSRTVILMVADRTPDIHG